MIGVIKRVYGGSKEHYCSFQKKKTIFVPSAKKDHDLKLENGINYQRFVQINLVFRPFSLIKCQVSATKRLYMRSQR